MKSRSMTRGRLLAATWRGHRTSVPRGSCRARVTVLVAAFTLLAGAVESQAQGGVETDRAALVALYNATGGPNWRNNTNWNSDAPLDQWYGVETDSTGRVTRLDDFRGNGLSGPIPAELGSLANLAVLHLADNNLSGPIPAELGSLANLAELNLIGNNLSGPIPAELGSLANLAELYLSDNNLSGPIPAELGNLTNLKYLGLAINSLSGPIPAELGNLTNLTDLFLADNNLSGPIPVELEHLTNLQSLFLADNNLSGPIPAGLGSLGNLYTLRLEENNLSGPVPGELGNLTQLVSLLLHSNELSEPLPLSMTNLRRPLNFLYIYDNAGLCAPADAVFQEWVATLFDFRGDTCGEDPATVPGAPTGLMLAPGDAALAGSWTAPANDGGSAITGYKVQWRSGGEDWDPTTRETSTTMTEHRISGLTNGVNYTVRVAAVNALGTGAWSTEAAGMPGTPVPALPPVGAAVLALLLAVRAAMRARRAPRI